MFQPAGGNEEQTPGSPAERMRGDVQGRVPGQDNAGHARNGESWHALYIKTRFEKAVAEHIRAKGYEEFLPLYRRLNRWSDRMKEVEFPLFPGYIFCKFDPARRLPIITIPGVNGVVSLGKNLVAVDESELDAVRAVLRSRQYCEPCPFLNVGEWVRVEAGPLAGLEGFITMLKNKHRLIISVNLLQRSVAVEIDVDCVKPVQRQSRVSEPRRLRSEHAA